MGFPGGTSGKEPTFPGLGRSTGGRNSCREIPMDRGAWQATVHGVARQSDMPERLSTQHTETQKIGGGANFN